MRMIDSLLPANTRTELKHGMNTTGQLYPPEPINRAESQYGFFVRGQTPGTQAVHTATDIPISTFGGLEDDVALFVDHVTDDDLVLRVVRAERSREPSLVAAQVRASIDARPTTRSEDGRPE